MSAEEPREPGVPAGEPSEEELRAAYEAELSRLTSADLIAQAVVSLLNLGARRLGPVGGAPSAAGEGAGGAGQAAGAGERDLAQVRDAIDAVRPLLEVLERNVPEGVRPLRDALAQLQMAYAREVQSAAPPAMPAEPEAEAGAPQDPGTGAPAGDTAAGEAARSRDQPEEPGPAQKSGRLWVPGS